jgi:hypothetical protein
MRGATQSVGQCSLTLSSAQGYSWGLNLFSYLPELETAMPSRMMKTKTARKIRQARKGKTRKRKEQNKGTTPKFAIHLDQ